MAVLALLRAFSDLGHNVDLLSYPQGDPVQLAGVQHDRSLPVLFSSIRPGPSWAKLLLDVPFALEAAWRVLRGRYDVVHAVEEAAHLIAPVAALRGVRLVADVDSWIPEQLEESGFLRSGRLLKLLTLLNRAVLRRAALVVTPCRSLSDRVRAEIPRADVVQLDDLPLRGTGAAVPEEERARHRQALGLGEEPAVLYCGNFEVRQGVDLLVTAAAQLPEAQFVFVGGEPEQVERLASAARRNGSRERCHFLGKRAPEDVPALLSVADVVVAPRTSGRHTGFKIATYLASGRPLVATRIPAHTQVLDDALAVLVDPTPQAIAGGIRQVLSDPARVGAMASQARAHVREKLSPERFRTRLAEAYSRFGEREEDAVPASPFGTPTRTTGHY